MKTLIFAAAMAASPALAEVTMRDCTLIEDRFYIGLVGEMECLVKNELDTAVSSITFAVRIVQDGRSVAWADDGFKEKKRAHRFDIAGGLEPGEEAKFIVKAPKLSDRADRKKIRVEAKVLIALDANGEEIKP